MAHTAVQKSGEDSQRSAQPDTEGVPLQGQKNVHKALCPICLPTRGICGPGMGAMDSRGQAIAGASATTGSENDFRLQGRTYEEKCKEIWLDTLERRREDTDMIQTYKIITGVDNVKKDTWFKMAAENAE